MGTVATAGISKIGAVTIPASRRMARPISGPGDPDAATRSHWCDLSAHRCGVGSSTPATLSSAQPSTVTTPGATAADSVPAPATILGQAVNERLSGSESVGSASEEDEDEDEEDEDSTEKDDDEPDSEDEEVRYFQLF